MAEVTINNSPVHSDAILTAVFGETGSSWARYHTGTDFAPYGSTPVNPTLYSVCNGTVYSKTYDGTTPPTPPTPTERKRSQFPWVLFTNKIRRKRTLI